MKVCLIFRLKSIVLKAENFLHLVVWQDGDLKKNILKKIELPV